MAEFYRIHQWEQHQPKINGRGAAAWIKNYTQLLVLPKYRLLSPAQRGILHGLWLYRGLTGKNPPGEPEKLRSSLGVARDKHLCGTLKTLELRGFIVKVSSSEEREKKRERDSEGKPGSPPRKRPLSPDEIRTRLEVLKGGG